MPEILMAKPHILFVANEILGWKVYCRQLVEALQARSDVRHTILRRQPSRIVMQMARRHADGAVGRRLRPFDPIRLYGGILGRRIRREIEQARPDVMHVAAHWPAGALLGLGHRPPMSLALDATRATITRDFADCFWSEAERATEAELCRAAAHLFPMSEWAATSLTEDYGVDPDRVTVQPPSLRREVPAARSRDAADTDRLPQILFVGNDLRRKGADRLVEWVEGPLRGRCHLHIVSTDRSKLPLGPNVTFHGAVAHDRLISSLFPAMDVFCLPTLLDMSPFVLAEAAAAGLPVVASRLGGIPDLVRDGTSGLLVDAKDETGFVQSLLRLIEDAPLRRKMGQGALALARDRLDGKANYDRLIDRLAGLAESA